MLRVVFMGIQGSGKGTQAKMASQKAGTKHINIGAKLRWHIEHMTDLGKEIKELVDGGNFVSDEIVYRIIDEEIETHGFILDGFPRNLKQAEYLLNHYKIDHVILLELADEIAEQRMLARRLCSKCGKDYNLLYNPPVKENICDICGGELSRRKDDYPTEIESRLHTFHEKTDVVVELFDKKGMVERIDATLSPEKIHEKVMKILEKGPRKNK